MSLKHLYVYLLALGACSGFCVLPTAFASPLEYQLFVVDSDGNRVSGVKTQVTAFGIQVPLAAELSFDHVTLTLDQGSALLRGQVETCIGSNGCGSQYAKTLYSFNTLYGVPVGYGAGDLEVTLKNELAGSKPDARLFGAQKNAGTLRINEIDPRLPEQYAQGFVSAKLNPSAGYAFGVFTDEQYGNEFIRIDGWLVLDQLFAANTFYIETRAGSGQFDFHLVGCLVGGSAPGICGGSGESTPPPSNEVPEPMSASLLLAGMLAGAKLRRDKA